MSKCFLVFLLVSLPLRLPPAPLSGRRHGQPERDLAAREFSLRGQGRHGHPHPADPECDLDITPNKAVEAPVNVAISNSLGFGGHNATVLFKKV